jgi:hypothetical protein
MNSGCWVLRAMVLLTLDGRPGQWVPLDWLARRVFASQSRVEAECQDLVDAQLMQSAVVDGRPCVGVKCDETSAVCA